MSKLKSRGAMLAALLAIPGLALAASERESNHPVTDAQVLEIGPITVDGVATTGAIVDGVIGNLSGPAVRDADYFQFEGQANDVVTVDIDGGMGGLRDVDTTIAVLGPAPAYQVLRWSNDGPSQRDRGSISARDSIIVNFKLPATGSYTVGVANSPRHFLNGGVMASTSVAGASANGDYTLIISGVSIAVLQIGIEIKPGSGEVAPINPKSRGKVPVALLGASDFSVDEVDTGTLTFGHTGNEASLSKCGTPSDVNGDLFPDLVCHFENDKAEWVPASEEGIVRGRLAGGKRFEGRGWLKTIPVQAEE